MTEASLEHVNVTVTDPKVTADMLCSLFDWQVRWKGGAIDDGISYHVGGAGSYIAVYSKGGRDKQGDSYNTPGGLNHIGVVVDDIDATEKRVRAAGFEPHSHADYEPGKRFYFHAHDGIEIEVVSYAV
jgi:catechol 2,3-dioxygenase-like lactoylglutathione lyase family enzyme